jgi:hypothetical protein
MKNERKSEGKLFEKSFPSRSPQKTLGQGIGLDFQRFGSNEKAPAKAGSHKEV